LGRHHDKPGDAIEGGEHLCDWSQPTREHRYERSGASITGRSGGWGLPVADAAYANRGPLTGRAKGAVAASARPAAVGREGCVRFGGGLDGNWQSRSATRWKKVVNAVPGVPSRCPNAANWGRGVNAAVLPRIQSDIY
jgi:hypothetical protein